MGSSRRRALAALAAAAALPLAARARADTLACATPQALPGPGAHAPRVILIAGSLPQLTLDSVAHFLIGMGYPAERIADPHDGALSRSGYADATELAGEVAWHVERDGVAPILVGHSRGGMLVMRALHTLAGAFGPSVQVFDPVRRQALPRTGVDARGGPRAVVGLHVEQAIVIATGRLPRVWQGQWDMLPLLRRVPDTARAFTGFHIEGDMISGDALGIEPYVPMHEARVRNVVLPASYSHVGAVDLAHLAADARTRAFVAAWQPQHEPPLPDGADMRNLGLGAELWHAVRAAWCAAAQVT